MLACELCRDNEAANAKEDDERIRDSHASTLAICISVIAAVRLARAEQTGGQSPPVMSVVCG